MTVKEMHIEVGQSTQKISTNANRKLYPEEIDWLLNKSSERFVQSKIKPKKDGSGAFEIDQMNLDAVRPLLKSKQLAVDISETERYKAILPGDYAYLLSDDSYVKLTCGADLPATTTVTKSYKIVPLSKQTGPTPYYVAPFITVGSVTVALATINTAALGSYVGYANTEQYFMLRDIFMHYLSNAGVEVYWEKYGNVYAAKSFIIVTDFNVTANFTGNSVVTIGSGTVTTKTYSFTGFWSPNRLTQTDKVSTLLRTPWSTASAYSPISKLEGNTLIVHGDDSSFIVSSVNIDYIKKQRRIELILGQDCELAPEFHMAVCDLAVEYYKGITTDPNWEVKLKDNMLRSPNV